MFIAIDPADPLPIYEQIVRRLKFAIANGAVRSGELIPSVRDLARELAINPNTVARAYRDLQAQGIVSAVRGTGLVVATGAVDRCQPERLKLIRARLRQVFEEARHSGISDRELKKLIAHELGQLKRQKVSP